MYKLVIFVFLFYLPSTFGIRFITNIEKWPCIKDATFN
uniref:Uncharacterized protein n=1 Tax=Rhizophora mucronata TaxID=61149 RepID=A0A2P2QX26_RHIMU